MQLRSTESSSDDNKIDNEPKSQKRKADRIGKLISSVNSMKSSIYFKHSLIEGIICLQVK